MNEKWRIGLKILLACALCLGIGVLIVGVARWLGA